MDLLRWQIGDAVVTRITESEFDGVLDAFLPQATPEAVLALDWLRPHFITDQGVMKFSIHALVVEADGQRIIVDTCVGNHKPRDVFPLWHMQNYRFLEDLAAAGFPPESIDFVLCTHLHLDHVGWNTRKDGDRWVPTFPKARYLIARHEFEQSRAAAEAGADALQVLDGAILADSVLPVMEAGLVDLVEPDHRISPCVQLIPTPGHTAGHVSVRITSAGRSALITGDFIHHPCQLAHPEWSITSDFDPAQSAATRRERCAEIADTGTLMIGTHWPTPTAARITRDGSAYRLA